MMMMMVMWGLVSTDVGLTYLGQLTTDDDDDGDVGLSVHGCRADLLGTTYN